MTALPAQRTNERVCVLCVRVCVCVQEEREREKGKQASMPPLQVVGGVCEEKSGGGVKEEPPAYSVWPAVGHSAWRELRERRGRTVVVERGKEREPAAAKALPEVTLEDVKRACDGGRLWVVIEAYA